MTTATMAVYKRLDIEFDHGKGVWLFDTQGNRYLDAISGIGVCNLGHAHPTISKALHTQAEKLIHTSNMFRIPEQERLAEALTQLTGMEKAFFANSGAEANEAAIKLARLHGHQQGIEHPAILVFDKSFHGRTLATLSASGNRAIQAGYEPLVSGFVRAPFNDLDALAAIAKNSKNICAILLEPILGNGGIIIPSAGYLRGIRELCDQNDWLMIVDEIQTGMGRTGKWYAFQHTDIQPDVLTTAKALANGVPIGACLAQGNASELFQPGKHGSTFGGNPLACHAARTVLQIMQQEKVPENVQLQGNYLLQNLTEVLTKHPQVTAVRGKGLMLGIELNQSCKSILLTGLKHGLLFNITAERVIRLLPPLIINQQEADLIVEKLNAVITDHFQQ